jgi:transposase
MNRLKAIYRSQAIKCSGSSIYHPSKRQEWLAKLIEPGIRFRAETLFTELETLTALRKAAKQKMINQARKHKDFKRLCQIPGLGFVNVSRLLAQVGTPDRFQTKRQFWKYCGLAVTITKGKPLV